MLGIAAVPVTAVGFVLMPGAARWFLLVLSVALHAMGALSTRRSARWPGQTVLVALGVAMVLLWSFACPDEGMLRAMFLMLLMVHLGLMTPRPYAEIGIAGAAAAFVAPLLLLESTGGSLQTGSSAVTAVSIGLLVLAIRKVTETKVRDQARILESYAFVDGLTGIPNRRFWDSEIVRILEQAKRSGEPVVVGIIDLDRFKQYNDLHGHPAGDRLLQKASMAWRQELRSTDMIARYGGEEFGLILRCELWKASVLMDRLRECTPEDQTFSAGLAFWTGNETAEELTARADAALYTAKREGRDRYTVTGHPACTDLKTNFSSGVSAG